MFKRLFIIAALAGIGTPALAQTDAPAKLESSGALFGIRESVLDIDISPDGNHIVYLTPGQGRVTSVYYTDLADGTPKLVIQSNGSPERLAWCKFATNARLVCSIEGMIEKVGELIPFSRLVAVDIDGKNLKELGQKGSSFDARIRQFDGEIIDWLPKENGAVLMARDYVPEAGKNNTHLVRNADGMGVDRIDLTTMQSTRVENPSLMTDYYITDGVGNVRMKAYQPREGGTEKLDAATVYEYRLPGSREWQRFSIWNGGDDGMLPLDIDAGKNAAYVLKKLDGRLALYRVKLDGSMASELVYKNDKVDVDNVVRLSHGAPIVGVTFAEDKRSVVYFDPEYRDLAASLADAIPALPMIGFLASSADGNKLLIRAGSDSDPGHYFIYDKTKHVLNDIMLARPTLENVKLATVKSITYPAGDGTLIPAYLTLPPGQENARGLPAVVLPHGGPSARDEWGFDWLAQFLAHQGYAVLQPNYRGSAGFGDAWMQENGFQGWQISVGDVCSAGKWLSAQGIADPKKLAVVGWSYGGYAALQSGVLEPGLFKAIVAIAPVTDLELYKQEAKAYTNSQLVARMIGSGPHVSQGSPLQNVARITVPVLLFHGNKDQNVDVEQSRKMDAKLRAAGKPSELVEYDGLEHDLADSNVRAQMLDKIDEFLKTNFSTK